MHTFKQLLALAAVAQLIVAAPVPQTSTAGLTDVWDDLKNVAGSAVDNLSGNGNSNSAGNGNDGNGNDNGSGNGSGDGDGNVFGNGNSILSGNSGKARRATTDPVSSMLESIENAAGDAIGNLDENGNGNAAGNGNDNNGNGNGSGNGSNDGDGNNFGNGNSILSGNSATSRKVRRLKRDSTSSGLGLGLGAGTTDTLAILAGDGAALVADGPDFLTDVVDGIVDPQPPSAEPVQSDSPIKRDSTSSGLGLGLGAGTTDTLAILAGDGAALVADGPDFLTDVVDGIVDPQPPSAKPVQSDSPIKRDSTSSGLGLGLGAGTTDTLAILAGDGAALVADGPDFLTDVAEGVVDPQPPSAKPVQSDSPIKRDSTSTGLGLGQGAGTTDTLAILAGDGAALVADGPDFTTDVVDGIVDPEPPSAKPVQSDSPIKRDSTSSGLGLGLGAGLTDTATILAEDGAALVADGPDFLTDVVDGVVDPQPPSAKPVQAGSPIKV